MPAFLVADLDVRGDLRSRAEYRYEDLEMLPGASELIGQFSSRLYAEPKEFDTPLPGRPHLTMRWLAAAETAGIATLRCRGELASVSLLATGLDADADRITIDAFQRHLLRELHAEGVEAGFAITHLKERPLIATTNFFDPKDPADQLIVALADRCFAASYFRYHHLA